MRYSQLKMVAPVLIKLILLVLCVLVSIAFVTLLERKVLSYMQKRKGPNKVGFKGILQPVSDVVKLFSKEPMLISLGNLNIFLMSPILSLVIMLSMWLSFPSSMSITTFVLSAVYVLCCLSASVYPVLGAGWASNSKYPLLASLRSVAQTISYEVSLIFILLCFLLITKSLSLDQVMDFNMNQMLLFLSPPLAIMWFITSLAETNRTPFDFSEGESELVSGFNTEFSSGGFALFFMAEYGSILFMSVFFSVVFLGGADTNISFPVKIILVVSLFIWVRGTLPRLRYDKLMMTAWKSFLPVSVGYLVLISGVYAAAVWFYFLFN